MIPEFRELVPIPEFRGIPSDSQRFRNSGHWFRFRNHTILLTHICDVVLISYFSWTRSNLGTEFRNSAEFLRIPSDSGIPGIGSNSVIPRNSFQFPVIPEFRPIPSDSGIPGIGSDSGIANRNHTSYSPTFVMLC